MTKPGAFWISPEGNIHRVIHTHLKYVLQHPGLFPFDPKKYESLLESCNEQYGEEGKARRMVLTDIIKEGWIRVRFTARPYYYTLETWKFDEKMLNNIRKWALEASAKDILYKHTDLRFVEDATNKTWKRDLDEFLQSTASQKKSKR